MKTIGQFQFPETQPETDDWAPFETFRPLHSRVLCVARTRSEGAWAAYCLPVSGRDHNREKSSWRTDGCKLPEHIAAAIFPRFDGVPYAH